MRRGAARVAAKDLVHDVAPENIVHAVHREADLDARAVGECAHALPALLDVHLVVAEPGRVGREPVVVEAALGPMQLPRPAPGVRARERATQCGALRCAQDVAGERGET